jgi:hypothetical protein
MVMVQFGSVFCLNRTMNRPMNMNITNIPFVYICVQFGFFISQNKLVVLINIFRYKFFPTGAYILGQR